MNFRKKGIEDKGKRSQNKDEERNGHTTVGEKKKAEKVKE